MRKVYQEIASAVSARLNCIASNNIEWQHKHEEKILNLVKNYMPSGSGVDNGTRIDFSNINPKRIVFYADFHHMNDNGYYSGWTEHTIIVTPSFDGFDLRITGRDRNDIKEYLGDLFHHALNEVVG